MFSIKKMDKIKLQIKQIDNRINDNAKILELVSNRDSRAKEELLHQLIAKEVVISKVLNLAVEMFIQYEKELGESNQIIKGYEICLGD